MAVEIACAIEGQAHAADATDPLRLGRQPVGHRPQVGHGHNWDRHLAFCEQGRCQEASCLRWHFICRE